MSPCSPPGSLQEGRESPAAGDVCAPCARLGAAGAAVVSPVDASQVPAGLRAAVIKLRGISVGRNTMPWDVNGEIPSSPSWHGTFLHHG